ncbi:HipA N-terminal domain-containing protein [Desulfonatronum thiosulfatophilum]|uniref:HipA N-terminal domain-containing protein n=1 Tax=Desulfonatronum thiosulfatophilum TaxID=617002 RepID=A0A1G6CTT3_9BACT|nr:HipA N-terminal domain-containing protein [Desulfonatronum thiosulfatophilum]
MGRRKLSRELSVWMNGLRVGTLRCHSSGKLEFAYHEQWMRENSARPLSLSMPLRAEPYSGEVVENYYDNLLPDNQAVRRHLQRKFQTPSDNSFDLLSHIGRDCTGAVQLCPIERDPPPVHDIDATPVSDDQIAGILSNSRIMPLGISGDDDFRISLAGAQDKTALLHHDGRWHRPHGSTPTTHILKLPIGRLEHQNIDLSDSVGKRMALPSNRQGIRGPRCRSKHAAVCGGKRSCHQTVRQEGVRRSFLDRPVASGGHVSGAGRRSSSQIRKRRRAGH